MPALVVWASGAITGHALVTMADQMLGIDPRRTTATMVACLRVNDPERLEQTFRVCRRAICKGAEEVWWRLHLPTENEPESLFCIPNPCLTEEQRTAKYDAFMAKRCRHCLGNFAVDLQAWGAALPAPAWRGHRSRGHVPRPGMYCPGHAAGHAHHRARTRPDAQGHSRLKTPWQDDGGTRYLSNSCAPGCT